MHETRSYAACLVDAVVDGYRQPQLLEDGASGVDVGNTAIVAVPELLDAERMFERQRRACMPPAVLEAWVVRDVGPVRAVGTRVRICVKT